MLALLLLLATRETREVISLRDDSVQELNAWQFVAGLSYDGFVLKDAKLYDSYSLTPPNLQEKDCAT